MDEYEEYAKSMRQGLVGGLQLLLVVIVLIGIISWLVIL